MTAKLAEELALGNVGYETKNFANQQLIEVEKIRHQSEFWGKVRAGFLQRSSFGLEITVEVYLLCSTYN